MISLNKKYIMAVTGAFLSFFVVGHLLGNLQIFLGPEWLNSYAEHLMELPVLLWPMRIALLIALVTHVALAVTVSIQNKSARPVSYGHQATVQASLASRTMLISGFMILFFIIFHLLHYTFGQVHPEFFNLVDSKGRHDVYSMVVLSFRDPWISVSYFVAVFFLAMHLSHGFSSIFQSLGLVQSGHFSLLKKAGYLFSAVIFIAYASIPVACYLGWLKPLQAGRAL